MAYFSTARGHCESAFALPQRLRRKNLNILLDKSGWSRDSRGELVVIEINRCRNPEEMSSSAKTGLARIRQQEYAAMVEGAVSSLCYGLGFPSAKKLCGGVCAYMP